MKLRERLSIRAFNPLRFSLGTMLLLVVCFAILLGWWRDRSRLMERIEILEGSGSSWGTSQVLGPPDTAGAGDFQTAWASSTPDGQKEWLIVEYQRSVEARNILIYETYNPGAVVKVTVFDQGGNEVEAWSGKDPTNASQTRGISLIPIQVSFPIRRIKIYLDSPAVPGWNEIDAVGLTSKRGVVHWAHRAYSSSSFGKNHSLPKTTLVEILTQRGFGQ